MPNFENITPLLETAKAAGAAIMQIYQSGQFSISQKQDKSPLTEADLAAHKIITADLKKFAPHTHIISEESYKNEKIPPSAWLVDPLDGTKEFLNQSDEFTVNIAYMQNYQVIFGIVYIPAKDKLYVGDNNKAYLQQGDKKIPLQTRTKLPQNLTICSSLRHDNETAMKEYLKTNKLNEKISFIKAGSSLKFCLVADGTADLYIRLAPTYIWDSAAGHAILKAAGGNLLTPKGKNFTYNQQALNEGFIAASQELTNILKG